MRSLLSCLLLVCLWPLSGCETAWGGSQQSSMANLNAKQTAQIDQEEASGQVSSEDAKSMKESLNETTQNNESINTNAQQAAPNPAGETSVTPYYN